MKFCICDTIIRAQAVRTSLHKTLNAEKPHFLSHGETQYFFMRNRVYAYLCMIAVKTWLNNETKLGDPYFSVWLKSSNSTTFVFYDFYEQRNPGTRGSHVIKLMARLYSLQSFHFSVLFCFFLSLFSYFFVLFVIFRAASLFLFNSIIENWILNIFLKIVIIVIIIIRCSGMFQNVPCKLPWYLSSAALVLLKFNCSFVL